MGAIASQITSLTIVYSIIYSGVDQRKHQSSASLGFVWGFHRGPVNSPHKGPVTRKIFPFDDVIMRCDMKILELSSVDGNRCITFPLFRNIYQPSFNQGRSAPGPRFSIKMSFYPYRKSHCGDKTVVRSSYLHSGIFYTGKMASLYWFNPQIP